MRNNLFSILGIMAFSLFCTAAIAQDFRSEVVVESLPGLSLNTNGTISTQNTALWSKTPSEKLLSLTETIGNADLSPAQRALITYLMQLETSGASFNDSDNILGNNRFFAARLKVLENQGQWDEALKLLELASESDISREMKQSKINVLFLKGEEKKACALLDELPESENKSENMAVDKMRISCFLAQEEKDKAILAYDIFQDTYPDADPVFIALADTALRELPATLPDDLTLSPADVYLYALVKNPKLDLSKQTRGIKKTLSELPAEDITFRITVGEQIGLTADELKRLYRLPMIKPDLDNPVIQRVFTYNQIFSTTDMDEQARLLFAFLALVKNDHLLVPLAPLTAAALEQIEPKEQYTDLALNAVQAYALTNNASAAEPWFKLLKKSSQATHREQYLYAALIMQTLGNGLPSDFEERFNKMCLNSNETKCQTIISFLPDDVLKDIGVEEKAPPLFTDNSEALSTRLGEFLLEAVLSVSTNKKAMEAYKFIQKAARPKEGETVLREGLVF